MHIFSTIFTQTPTRSLANRARQVCEDASAALARLTAPFKAPSEPVWAFAYVHGNRPRAADPLTFS
jgi:hypothetical protein